MFWLRIRKDISANVFGLRCYRGYYYAVTECHVPPKWPTTDVRRTGFREAAYFLRSVNYLHFIIPSIPLDRFYNALVDWKPSGRRVAFFSFHRQVFAHVLQIIWIGNLIISLRCNNMTLWPASFRFSATTAPVMESARNDRVCLEISSSSPS